MSPTESEPVQLVVQCRGPRVDRLTIRVRHNNDGRHRTLVRTILNLRYSEPSLYRTRDSFPVEDCKTTGYSHCHVNRYQVRVRQNLTWAFRDISRVAALEAGASVAAKNMQVRVLLFAACRRAVLDQDAITVEVPAERDDRGHEYCTVAALRQHLPDELRPLGRHLAVAVNLEYAEDWKRVYVQDEVALIPPVSGG